MVPIIFKPLDKSSTVLTCMNSVCSSGRGSTLKWGLLLKQKICSSLLLEKQILSSTVRVDMGSILKAKNLLLFAPREANSFLYCKS